MPLLGAGWPVWRFLGLFLGELPQVRLPLRRVLVLGPGQGRSLFLGYLRLSLGPHCLGLRGFLPGPLGLRPDLFGLPRRLAPGVAAHAAEHHDAGDLPDKSRDNRLLEFSALTAHLPGLGP
jgi:hypothetical protein